MRLNILIITLLLYSGLSGQVSDRIQSHLEIEKKQLYQDKSILKVFGKKDDSLGFKIDSALLTRDFNTLLDITVKLYKLEKKYSQVSPDLTARQLFDTTCYYILKSSFLKKGVPLQKLIKIGKKVGADTLIVNKIKKIPRNSIENVRKRQKIDTEKFNTRGIEKNKNGNSASLRIINLTSRNLYIYIADEYKGVAYPKKEFSLISILGCNIIIAETLDSFKTSKRLCLSNENNFEWIIEQ